MYLLIDVYSLKITILCVDRICRCRVHCGFADGWAAATSAGGDWVEFQFEDDKGEYSLYDVAYMCAIFIVCKQTASIRILSFMCTNMYVHLGSYERDV